MVNQKGQFVKGERNNMATEFKKGMIPWNKGSHLTEAQKDHLRRLNLGKKQSEETKRKISESHKEDKAYQWKGDNVGYDALHDWVKKHLGKAFECYHCYSTKKVQWANKSREYKRDLTDWLQLCQSCHTKYDKDHRGAKEQYERRISV